MTKALDESKFEKLISNSEKTVLVDFWAQWCGPCKMLAPILDQVEADLKDEIAIIKVNIEENPELGSKYGVRSIPTMSLFKSGKQVASKIGLHEKAKIIEWVQDNS